MVHLVPPNPTFRSAAERDVWLALKGSLREQDVLAANIRLTDEQGDHEADLVVALPGAGIAVIEVKGGSVSHDGKTWMQHDGSGSRPIDPVEQAARCKYALQTYLKSDPRWGYGRVRFGHLVAFPYSRVDSRFALTDCPRWLVLDRENVAKDSAGLVWDGLVRQETNYPPITEAEALLLAECLGGRMLPQRDVLAIAADAAASADLLTEAQAAVLNALSALPRVEVRGGAGSGKTWLAVEKARRLAADGQRVGLLCYSRGLAAFLQRRVEPLKRKHQPAYVGTFFGLGEKWGARPGIDDDPGYWEHRLPEQMTDLAHALAHGDRFDAFVVDEAQDFADSWWYALLAALRDPEHGCLYAFADDGQRVFARQGRPPVPLVPILLEENLRNTVQIGESFGPLGAMRMRLRGGAGAPVKFVECSSEDAVECADQEVDLLLEEGYEPEHVALLTTLHRHPEQTARQEVSQDRYWESFWDTDQVFYGHVLGFKGLERAAVVLAVNGFREDDRSREKLYVGLSRGRDRLVVCGDPEQIREVAGDAVLRRLRGA